MENNCLFWISPIIAYMPIDTDNPTSPINYIHFN